VHPLQLDLPQLPPQLHEPPDDDPDDLAKKPDINRFTRLRSHAGQVTPSVPALMLQSFSNLFSQSWHSNS